MATLYLRFYVNLIDYDLFWRYNGPLFHRWLPDNQNDCMILPTSEDNLKIKIWFERRGFVDKSEIKYNLKRFEVDPEIIPKQAILDGGGLFGSLDIQDLNDGNLNPLKNKLTGDTNYRKLGKRIYNLIYLPVSNFINILRYNFGQYWIKPLKEWDSREKSLGDYCKYALQLKWRLDVNDDLIWFEPDKGLPITITMPSKDDFNDFINKDDWLKINNLILNNYKPDLAKKTLAGSHQDWDQGNFTEAIIKAVTALEIAINNYFKERVKGNEILKKRVNDFLNTKIITKTTIVALLQNELPLNLIEDAINGIKLRHNIVHEGIEATEKNKREFDGLKICTATLFSGLIFKFPTIPPKQIIMEVKNWNNGNSKSIQ